MRFYRGIRSSKVPAAVAVKFREASADKSGVKMKALFAEFLECKENWLSSSIVMTESQRHDHKDGGRWGWLTRDDTLMLYSLAFWVGVYLHFYSPICAWVFAVFCVTKDLISKYHGNTVIVDELIATKAVSG